MAIKQTKYATIGWKKVYSKDLIHSYIVQLLIPAKTPRHKSYTNRVPAVKVLGIFTIKGGGFKNGCWTPRTCGKILPDDFVAYSGFDQKVKYQAGKTTKSDRFSRQNEDCASGIHYFDTIQAALDY